MTLVILKTRQKNGESKNVAQVHRYIFMILILMDLTLKIISSNNITIDFIDESPSENAQ